MPSAVVWSTTTCPRSGSSCVQAGRDDYRWSSLILGIVRSGRISDASSRRSRDRPPGKEDAVIITRQHLSRRTVLRGLGASVALPLLDGMVPALTATAGRRQRRFKRLALVYVPNGMAMGYWMPKADGPLDELPPTLESLSDYRDKVLMVSGWPTSRRAIEPRW